MLTPHKIIRSNRKTLAISIDRFGRLIVRAPKKYSEERIFAFIKEKESWIIRKQAEIKQAGMRLPSDNLHGYEFLLLGKQTKVFLYEEEGIRYDSEKNYIFLPEKDAKERLTAWLKENALRIFTTVTAQKAAQMVVGYKKVEVSAMRSRWGCCTPDSTIRYSFRLLYCPKDVIEYVVVHELSHIRQHGHTKAFWQEVERYMPDWKPRRRWLKTHGSLMEIF
jgi:predicted metal-dependent hydrolase